MTGQRQKRFINSNLPQLQDDSHNPLSDYEDTSVQTLEEAVKNLTKIVPDVATYVSTAKKDCNQNTTIVTHDESAAIYLYTMPIEFFFNLNRALRDENRQVLKPWLHFLKLFVTALKNLPPTKATIWRGVNYDATLNFVDNDVHVWWDINSCSMNINSVQPFLGESGTLFAIETIHGRDISMLSAFPDEKEVILTPGTRVRNRYQSLNYSDRLFIIHLEEIVPQG
jgi:hypothetical protein